MCCSEGLVQTIHYRNARKAELVYCIRDYKYSILHVQSFHEYRLHLYSVLAYANEQRSQLVFVQTIRNTNTFLQLSTYYSESDKTNKKQTVHFQDFDASTDQSPAWFSQERRVSLK